MNKSESIAAISQAIAKAQGEVENASKNAKNPHFKSKYADLAELLNTVRPVFSIHGLAIVQMPSFDGGIASVETMIIHYLQVNQNKKGPYRDWETDRKSVV